MAGEKEQANGTLTEVPVISRSFNVPKQLVWKALTGPERFMQWRGPKDNVI